MEFQIKPQTVGDWRELLRASPQANWMQSWPYAKATYLRDHKATRLVTLQHKGGPIGFMALQEIRLGPVYLLELHRGPLWFTENPSENLFQEFSQLFQEQYRNRWLQRRRWLPEWETSETTQSWLQSVGFQSLPQTFETLWLDLRKPLEQIRSELHQKWRNSLHKSERLNLEIESSWKAQNLELFLKHYELHKALKGFHGVSSAFVREEIRHALPFQEALLLWARHSSQDIAGGYFLIHGLTMSYRIGWNTSKGRECNAHYGLLWKAIELAKSRGLQTFDLGGIKPTEAAGVTRFKLGLGGQSKKLLGLYR